MPSTSAWLRASQQRRQRRQDSTVSIASTDSGSERPAAVASTSTSRPGFRIDLGDFFTSQAFKDGPDGVTQEELEGLVRGAVSRYEMHGEGNLHLLKHEGKKNDKIWSLDITGVPSERGRGKWRLWLKEINGVLHAYKFSNHKSR